jgi:mannose/cellobiose epimerase-like protein (N-acyl-D-glucosamine 2-epimerase family)
MPQTQKAAVANASENTLGGWSGKYSAWLSEAALPLWWEKGADRSLGGFFEKLKPDGEPDFVPRRASVQARQSIAYAMAGTLGWEGPWREACQAGLAFLDSHFKRRDGLYARLISYSGETVDETPALYDHAFALFAAAEIVKAVPARRDLLPFARQLARRIEKNAAHGGGFRENCRRPYQSKTHIPLMEAALSWCAIDDDPVWRRLADGIGNHCLGHLFDSDAMLLREYFDENWATMAGTGGTIEPGHHFEWSHLIGRWARLTGSEEAWNAALRLFEVGSQGVDEKRGVAMDAFGADFNKCCETARLWPQAERLVAALFFAAAAEGDFKQFYLDQAADAAAALWRYLKVPRRGLWRDRMLADGSFADESSPASSLYHLVRASAALAAATA